MLYRPGGNLKSVATNNIVKDQEKDIEKIQRKRKRLELLQKRLRKNQENRKRVTRFERVPSAGFNEVNCNYMH